MFKSIKGILKNNFLGFNSFSGPESKKKQKHLRLPFLLQLEDRITPASSLLDYSPLFNQSSLLIPDVSTDLADYPPGSTAIISANHFLPGSDITFQVVHIIGPGADGKLGTLDDILGNNTGSGHKAWVVTDGGNGDFDGIANGLVQTSWYVNPDDSLNETFLLTAKGGGLDGVLGSPDDQIATFSFTDAIPQADLSASQTDGKTSLVPGTSNTYTITVTNNGSTTVRSLTLIDSIPAGLLSATFGSPSSGSYDRNSGLWNGITLKTGKSLTINLTGTVSASATGSLTNSVTITAPSNVDDLNLSNNTASDVDIMTPQVDLSVSQSDGKTSIVPGTSNTYTNNGPSAINSFTLTDAVPAGLLNPVFRPSLGTYNSTTGLWNGLTLASGNSVTITLSGTIDPAATGSITNTVSISLPSGVADTNSANNSAANVDTLTPEVDLSVSQTDGKISVVPGTSNTYTITVTNNGPSTINSFTLIDAVPDGLLNPLFTPSSGTYNNSSGLWDGLNLASGNSITITLTGNIDPTATGSITNAVSISAPSGVADTNSSNNSTTDVDSLVAEVDLSVIQSDGKTSVIPGTTNTYSITVTNNGSSTATNILVTDMLPDGTLSATWTGSNGSSGSGDLEDTIATLASGENVTYELTLYVSGTATGLLVNNVDVFSENETNNSDNSATDINILTPQVDIGVTASNDGNAVVPGTPSFYMITVTNYGPSTATNIKVSDLLPDGIKLSTWVATNGSSGSGELKDTIPTLDSGESVDYLLLLDIPEDLTGSIVNIVSVETDNDTDTLNNTIIDEDTLTPQVNINVKVSNDVNSLVPGTSTTYTITVTNSGPSTATNVKVSDLLPDGLLSAMWTGSNGSTGNGNLSDTIVSLASEESVTYSLTCNISESLTGSVVNSVNVSSEYDTDATDNTAIDEDIITPQVDLSVTLSDSKTSVVPGTNTTYTNSGPSKATNISVSNLLPEGVISALWEGTNGSFGTGELTDIITSLDSGMSTTYLLTFNISPSLTGSMINVVNISSDSDINSANNSATDTDALTPEIDLSVSQTDGNASVISGTDSTYTITVTNNGPSTISSFTMTDVIPAELLNAVFGTPSSGAYDNATKVWNGLNLNTGDSVTITLTGTIAPTATGSITNAVSVSALSGVSDTNSANDIATDIDTLTPQVDLSVTQTDNKTSVVPGTSNTYTITVTNNGPSTINSFAMTDVIPAGLLNASFGIPSSGNYDSATKVWNGLSLATGTSVTITLTGTIDPTSTGSITNTVSVSPLSGISETNSANNSTADVNTLSPQVDLSVTQTDGKTSILPGTTNTYTITVTNNGPSTLNSFTMTDVIPAGLLGAVFGTPSSGSYNSNSGVWSGLNFREGNTVTITLIGTVSPAVTGSITNVVSVSAPIGVTETNSANNSSTDVDSLGTQVDLSVTQTDNKTSVVPGTLNTYTITVTNNGQSTVSSLTMTDVIPAELLNPLFGTPSSGTYNNSTGLWNGLNLAPGKSIRITLRGTVSPTATGSITNTVSVSPADGYVDSNSTNNLSSDVDTLTPQVDLQVTQTDNKTSVVPGTNNTYTITVTNNGPSTVSSFTMTDVIPAQLLNAVFGTPSSGTYNNITGVWSGLSLGTGNSVTITLGGTIAPAATGSITNTVSVAAPNGVTDTKLSNNNASDINLLTPQADLVVTQTDGKTSVVPGTSNTYTITVTNNGPSTIVNFTLTDVIPASLLGATFGTPSSGRFNVSTGLWSGLNLVSGGSVTITLTGTISPTANGSITNTVTVKTPSGMTDLNTANNTSVDTDSLTPIASLSVMLSDAKTSVAPGTRDTYTITITNKGPSMIKSFLLTTIFSDWFLNPSFGTPSSGSYNSTTGLWNGINLASGKSISITLKGMISPNATGDIINIARVAPTSEFTDNNPDNKTAYDINKLIKV